MIYRVENGAVVRVWQDCKTLDEWSRKYLDPVLVIEQVGEVGDADYEPPVYQSADTPKDMFEGEAVVGQLVEIDGTRTNPPKPLPTASEIRLERTKRIAASDWTQLADTPLSEPEKASWAEYRQGLRDVTGQAGFPAGVVWPVEPK